MDKTKIQQCRDHWQELPPHAKERATAKHFLTAVAIAERQQVALDEAMKIIEKVGTTGIEHQHKQAEQWMRSYYPEWA